MNRYEVISDFTAKTPEGIKELKKRSDYKTTRTVSKAIIRSWQD